MKEQYAETLSKGDIGEALAYSIKRWDRLMIYTEDGSLNIDNNPVVDLRSNFMSYPALFIDNTPRGQIVLLEFYSHPGESYMLKYNLCVCIWPYIKNSASLL